MRSHSSSPVTMPSPQTPGMGMMWTFLTTTDPGTISAPGPGSPDVVLSLIDVVAGWQKTETMVPAAVFG